MAETVRPEPFLLADNSALDFLNSIAAPSSDDIEWISNGCDLLAWLDRTGLCPSDVLKKFGEETAPEKLDAVAADARKLREWFREFIAAHTGQQPGPSTITCLDRLNHLLKCDAVYRQIEEGKHSDGEPVSSLQMREYRRWDAPKDLLLPIAEAMSELICRPDFERVKNCEGPTCTMWFFDVSKNHTRRWCAMEMCGNRAKAATHRAKNRRAKHQ